MKTNKPVGTIRRSPPHHVSMPSPNILQPSTRNSALPERKAMRHATGSMSHPITGSVHRIVYVSHASLWLGENAVGELVRTARNNNARMGVTGALFFERGRFFQVLEGDRSTILALFDRIRSDDRHSEVQLLIEDDLENRQFASWSMAWNRVNNVILSERFSDLKQSVVSPTPVPSDLEMIHKFLVVLHGSFRR
jgi:hypothetical protein